MDTCIKVRSSLGPKAMNLDLVNTPRSNKTHRRMKSQLHISTAMIRKSTKYFLNKVVHEMHNIFGTIESLVYN